MNRREFLRATAVAAGAFAGSRFSLGATSASQPTTVPLAKKYITCFYQFTPDIVKMMSGEKGLPNGEKFLHIFSHSHPGTRVHSDTAQAVHDAGKSFKYAIAFDLHKYKGILNSPDEKLKDWCKEFRQTCFDSNADYFAFNEMPTDGAKNLEVQKHVAAICRFLHDPGDGHVLPGIYYSTEQSVDPDHWKTRNPDFWKALDESCDLVVGEHYHSTDFVFSHKTPEAFADHLFEMAKYIDEGKTAAEHEVARDKYTVLHSSYYGPSEGGWHGPTTKEGEAVARKYLKFCIESTRASTYGKNRIAFGPLASETFDPAIVPILTELLVEDAQAWAKRD